MVIMYNLQIYLLKRSKNKRTFVVLNFHLLHSFSFEKFAPISNI